MLGGEVAESEDDSWSPVPLETLGGVIGVSLEEPPVAGGVIGVSLEEPPVAGVSSSEPLHSRLIS